VNIFVPTAAPEGSEEQTVLNIPMRSRNFTVPEVRTGSKVRTVVTGVSTGFNDLTEPEGSTGFEDSTCFNDIMSQDRFSKGFRVSTLGVTASTNKGAFFVDDNLLPALQVSPCTEDFAVPSFSTGFNESNVTDVSGVFKDLPSSNTPASSQDFTAVSVVTPPKQSVVLDFRSVFKIFPQPDDLM